MMRPISSARSMNKAFARRRYAARSLAFRLLHPLKAFAAAAIAALVSVGPAAGTDAITSPVAGL